MKSLLLVIAAVMVTALSATAAPAACKCSDCGGKCCPCDCKAGCCTHK